MSPREREAFHVVHEWLSEQGGRLFAALRCLFGLLFIYLSWAMPGGDWGVRIRGTGFGLFHLALGIAGMPRDPTVPWSRRRYERRKARERAGGRR